MIAVHHIKKCHLLQLKWHIFLNLHFADMKKSNSSNQPVISSAIFVSGADSSVLGCNLKGKLESFILKKKIYVYIRSFDLTVCVICRSSPLAGRFTFGLFKAAEQTAASGGNGMRSRAGRVGLSLGCDK